MIKLDALERELREAFLLGDVEFTRLVWSDSIVSGTFSRRMDRPAGIVERLVGKL